MHKYKSYEYKIKICIIFFSVLFLAVCASYVLYKFDRGRDVVLLSETENEGAALALIEKNEFVAEKLVWKVEIDKDAYLSEILIQNGLDKEDGINIILTSKEGVVCDVIMPDGLTVARHQKVQAGWKINVRR